MTHLRISAGKAFKEAVSPYKRDRLASVTLFLLTLVNLIAGVTSLVVKPETSSWMNSTKLQALAVWNATGYTSFAIIAGWIVVSLSLGTWSVNVTCIGVILAIAHTVFWIIVPSWC